MKRFISSLDELAYGICFQCLQKKTHYKQGTQKMTETTRILKSDGMGVSKFLPAQYFSHSNFF